MAFWLKWFSLLIIQGLFLLKASGQILTLSRKECTKVEVEFKELVPNHKYAPIISGEVDFFGENKKKYSDTTSILLEDKIIIFFVWHKNSVLRLVTRKETNNLFKNRPNKRISKKAANLTGLGIREVYEHINSLQKQGQCTFIHPTSKDLTFGYLGNGYCLPLVLEDNDKPTEYYRIFDLASFSINQNSDMNQNYKQMIYPNYSFKGPNAGFTVGEATKLETSKPYLWHFKLVQIYEQLFSTTWNYQTVPPVDFEGNKPIPYFNPSDFQNCSLTFFQPFNQVNFRMYEPVYLEKKVVGYSINFNKINSETKGYLIIPNKLFIPNRLKIISVNDIPWNN